MATLRALECFVAVCQFGSVTEAAARLHMSQPALSHQIAALEREIGTSVVSVSPAASARRSRAGRSYQTLARRWRQRNAPSPPASRRWWAAADRVRGKHDRRPAGAGSAGLAPAPPRRASGADRAVQRRCARGSRRLGTVDLAVGPRPSRWEGFESLAGSEEVVAAMASGAGPEPVTFTQLAERSVVGYHPDNGLGAWLDDVAAERGVALTALTRTRNATTAAHLAAAGLGVALVPTTALPHAFPGAVRRLDPPLRRDVVVLLANPHDPLARRFDADICRRGVRVPADIAAQLGPAE